jgi:hypothetical protein
MMEDILSQYIVPAIGIIDRVTRPRPPDLQAKYDQWVDCVHRAVGVGTGSAFVSLLLLHTNKWAAGAALLAGGGGSIVFLTIFTAITLPIVLRGK